MSSCTVPQPPDSIWGAIEWVREVVTSILGCGFDIASTVAGLGIFMFFVVLQLLMSSSGLLVLLALLKILHTAITSPLELPFLIFRLVELAIRFVDWFIELIYRVIHMIMELIPF